MLGERGANGDGVEAVANNVKGMIFLGTPFAGSNAAKWGELVRKIFELVKKTDQGTLKTLKAESSDLQELGEAFPEVIRKRSEDGRKVNIVFFYETLDTYKVRVRISPSKLDTSRANVRRRSSSRNQPRTPALEKSCQFEQITSEFASSTLQTTMATSLSRRKSARS